LQAFALASHHKLLYSSDLVAGKTSTAIKGQFTTEEGVSRILANTSLKYEVTTNGLVMIRAANVADPPDDLSQRSNTGQATKEGKKDSSDGFLVAQVDQGQTAGPSTVEKPDEQASKKKRDQLEEVIVTGSRIPTAAGQQTLPVRRYTREDIETSGQSTVAEYLNTLPEVSSFTNGLVQIGFAGVQPVQLHGLPAGTTLTLLDGRRIESSVLGFFDVSNIPASAVERIEILPVGASSIYGADALGGAVNFILRKDLAGFEINASLDEAPGVHNPGVNLAWGEKWDRGSVSLIASYDHRGELLGTQREPTSSVGLPPGLTVAQAVTLGNDGCAPGNVYSVDGTNLPGLSAPYAAIPAGITGRPTIGEFGPTAGKLNACSLYQYFDITPESNRESVLLSAHYELADTMDLFVEMLFAHSDQHYGVGTLVSASASFGGTLAAANPYNPFGQDVNVSFEDPTAELRKTQSSNFVRPTIGLRGDLFSDWHYQATASLSQDRLNGGFVFADSQLISNALASSSPATALNPFTTGPSGTPQLLSSFTDPAVDFSQTHFNNRLLSTEAIVRGPLLQTPAGPLQAVLGAEYQREKQESVTSGVGATSAPIDLRRTAYGVFSEARLPLLVSSGSPHGRDRLSLTAAGRYDHSDDYGGKATWQGGVQWRATDTLSLSGGYGKSYAAPQLSQISGPQTIFVGPLFVSDPFRGNQLVSYAVNQMYGSNFNLKPETGDSSTLKLAYTSDPQGGLRASLTWYRINIANYIGSPGTQVIVDNPNLYPGAVTRAPASPQDQQQGFLGPITQTDVTYYNYGDLHLAGFDADVSYAVDTSIGQFTPSVAIANIYRWQSALTPGAPVVDGVSRATLFGVGWAPRWKGTASLAWKRGPLSTNVAGRYIGRYLDYQDYVPNTNEIGNSWIFDVSARFDMGQAFAGARPWLAGSYVSLVAVNLFDKRPPFSFNPAWYDYEEYDIRGRYLRLSVGSRF